ncbi:hypothetical protein JL721_8260 [Aureococcus anophagefferens]|nr:hypothetical protein JL721_8260 [Aureococcus anophagefferens]
MRDPSGLRQRDESWHVGGLCIVVLVMCFFASLLAVLRVVRAIQTCLDARRTADSNSRSQEAHRRRALVMHAASCAVCLFGAGFGWLNFALDCAVGERAHDAVDEEILAAIFLGPLSFYCWLLARERCAPVFFSSRTPGWLEPCLYVLVASQAFVFVGAEVGDRVFDRSDRVAIVSAAFALDVAIVVVATLLFLLPFRRSRRRGSARRTSFREGVAVEDEDIVAITVRRSLVGCGVYVASWAAVWCRFYFFSRRPGALFSGAYSLAAPFCVAAAKRRPDTSATDAISEAMGAGRHHVRAHHRADEDHAWDGVEHHGIGDALEHREARRA